MEISRELIDSILLGIYFAGMIVVMYMSRDITGPEGAMAPFVLMFWPIILLWPFAYVLHRGGKWSWKHIKVACGGSSCKEWGHIPIDAETYDHPTGYDYHDDLFKTKGTDYIAFKIIGVDTIKRSICEKCTDAIVHTTYYKEDWFSRKDLEDGDAPITEHVFNTNLPVDVADDLPSYVVYEDKDIVEVYSDGRRVNRCYG
jgi:hypothetical protein